MTKKQLSEMTREELWQIFPIVLSEHQKRWEKDFQKESHTIQSNISDNTLRITHIGSTAVRGLQAKPIIDILLEIKENTNIDSFIAKMETMGYIYSSQPHNPAPYMMFMKGYTPDGFAYPVYHVHVRYSGDWDEIYFRDYLRTHPKIAKEYAALKIELKAKFEHNRDAYTDAKSEFVKRITKLARQENTTKYYSGRIPACGVFCGGCPMFTREKKPCPGAEINYKRCEGCKTFHLCCKERHITHCFQCPSFPCQKFKRFTKSWLKYGQNLISNQELLKEKGIEFFLTHYNKTHIIDNQE